MTEAWKDDIKKSGNVRRALTILRRVEWSKVPNLRPDINSLERGREGGGWGQIFQEPKSHLKIQDARRAT